MQLRLHSSKAMQQQHQDTRLAQTVGTNQNVCNAQL